MKIIEYFVITVGNSEVLTREVNYQLTQGWQPIGGISVDKNGYLLQAMVKYEEKVSPIDLGGMSDDQFKLKCL